jgi:hypothetical protein
MLTDSLGAVQSDLHALIKAVRAHTQGGVGTAPEISLVHDSELYYMRGTIGSLFLGGAVGSWVEVVFSYLFGSQRRSRLHSASLRR